MIDDSYVLKDGDEITFAPAIMRGEDDQGEYLWPDGSRMPDLLTCEDAIRVLRIDAKHSDPAKQKRALYRLVDNGLPYVIHLNRRHFRPAELDAYIEGLG